MNVAETRHLLRKAIIGTVHEACDEAISENWAEVEELLGDALGLLKKLKEL